MKLNLMAIYDAAAKAYLPPFCVASEAIAIRQLRSVSIEQPKHDFVRYSDQYFLFHLGFFDNETGKVTEGLPDSLGSLKVIFGLGDLNLQEKAGGTE